MRSSSSSSSSSSLSLDSLALRSSLAPSDARGAPYAPPPRRTAEATSSSSSSSPRAATSTSSRARRVDSASRLARFRRSFAGIVDETTTASRVPACADGYAADRDASDAHRARERRAMTTPRAMTTTGASVRARRWVATRGERARGAVTRKRGRGRRRGRWTRA